LLEILIRCRNDPDVYLRRARASDGFKFPLLKYSEYFGLQFKGHVPDFVEEQCSAIGERETANM
jgi:hypothetical protein